MINKSIIYVDKKNPERVVPLLVQTASRYDSSITFTRREKTANVKSIMGMLNFGLIPGEPIEVQIDGEDEKEAMEQIESFLTASKLSEE